MQYVAVVALLIFVINSESQLSAQENCGLQIVDELIAEGSSMSINESVGVGSWIVYSQYDPLTGTELWRTSGTPGDEEILLDILPGANSGNPRFFYSFNANIAVFYATNPDTGDELWRTDGTVAGTQMIADIEPGLRSSIPYYANFSQFIGVVDGYLYFTACTDSDGCEIWRTNGAENGTNRVTDLFETTSSSQEYSINADVYNLNQGNLIFINDYPNKLLITDGTLFGTYQIDESISSRHILNGDMYYRVDYGEDQLKVTDGSLAGTHVIEEVGELFNIFSFKNDLFIFLTSGDTLKVLNPLNDSLESIMPIDIRSARKKTEDFIYLIVSDPILGPELWKSDGTESGTQLIKEIDTSTTN